MSKKLLWTTAAQEIPLDECKKIGRVYNATVNDVMVSCLCGAMGIYMDRYQKHVQDVINVQAALLVNMRDPSVLLQSDKAALEAILQPSNCLGFLTTTVPLHGVRDPVERLEIIRRNILKEKLSPERYISQYSQYMLLIVPSCVVKYLYEYLIKGVTCK
jgi:diacylglycerol O-acyltransferase